MMTHEKLESLLCLSMFVHDYMSLGVQTFPEGTQFHRLSGPRMPMMERWKEKGERWGRKRKIYIEDRF